VSDLLSLYLAIVAGNATVMGPIELFLAAIIWDIRRRVIKGLNELKPREEKAKTRFRWPWEPK
jgi:hypothetical protein